MHSKPRLSSSAGRLNSKPRAALQHCPKGNGLTKNGTPRNSRVICGILMYSCPFCSYILQTQTAPALISISLCIGHPAFQHIVAVFNKNSHPLCNGQLSAVWASLVLHFSSCGAVQLQCCPASVTCIRRCHQSLCKGNCSPGRGF